MKFFEVLVGLGLDEYKPFNSQENSCSIAGRLVHDIVLQSKDKKELRQKTKLLESELDQMYYVQDKTIDDKPKLEGYILALDILENSRPIINSLYKTREEYPSVFVEKKIKGEELNMTSDWLMVRNLRHHLIEIKTGKESKRSRLQVRMQMLTLEEELNRTNPELDPYIVGSLVCLGEEKIIEYEPLDCKEKEKLRRILERSKKKLSCDGLH